MRRHAILSLALLVVLATAGSALAKSQSSHSKTSKYHRMHGTVESVDSTGQSFTVKHGGETSTFKTNDSTKFTHGTKGIAFVDLKTGDVVRVSFVEDGTDKTAATVIVVDAAEKDRKHPS
jgi:membrane protein implicated in regulation of membrane protease activity